MGVLTPSLSLLDVTRRFDGAGVPWALFAGAAAAAYGARRPLTDVDILVPTGDWVRVMALFPEAELAFHEEGSRILSLPGLDIVAGLDLFDLDAAMVTRLVRREVNGVPVPVIPAEDNILLKAMWGRGPEVGKYDWEDVEAMMASLPQLDWEYLRWRAGTFDRPQQVQQTLQRREDLWQRQGRATTHHDR